MSARSLSDPAPALKAGSEKPPGARNRSLGMNQLHSPSARAGGLHGHVQSARKELPMTNTNSIILISTGWVATLGAYAAAALLA